MLLLFLFHFTRKEVETRWCERILLSELHVNQNLLTKAPCSVGVIVDRGLKSEILDKGNLGTQQFNVTMLFTGGPDNREALAYAWRMAGSYVVRLTVLHFRLGEKVKSITEEVKESENDEQLDDKYVNEFRFKAMCNDRATYIEKVANNGEDIIRATKEMFDYHDLIYNRQGSRSAISFQCRAIRVVLL